MRTLGFALFTLVALGVLLIGDTAPAQAQLQLYDNFNDETAKIDPGKWVGTQDQTEGEEGGTKLIRRIEFDVTGGHLLLSHRVVGGRSPVPGLRISRNRLRIVQDPNAITVVEFDVKVTDFSMQDCPTSASVSDVRLGFIGFLFNDGSSTGPEDRTGDIIGIVGLHRSSDSTDTAGVLRAVGILARCTEPTCSGQLTTSIGSVLLGTVNTGDTVGLRMTWDRANNRVDFQKNADPVQSIPYTQDDSRPPIFALKALEARGQAPNCTDSPRPFAEITGLFDNVSVVFSATRVSTTTTVNSSANPSAYGQSVTFTATVSPVPPGTGTPSGTVTFTDGTATLGRGTLDGTGHATFSTSGLTVGGHSISAFYGGDDNFDASTSPALSQTVNKAGTTTAVTSSANPSVFGQGVTFTATVSPASPGAGSPTGTAQFKIGGVDFGSPVALSGGTATSSSISSLAVGNHTVTAVYSGDGNFNGSTSADFTQAVNRADTTTAVASSANPSVFGQSVTFTATVSPVSPGAGMPSGTVTFTDGPATLGTGTLDGTGHATFSTSGLAVGGHSISASYSGDGSFNGSTSGVLSQTVNKADTTTAVTASANPSVFGQEVIFTATVTFNPPSTNPVTGPTGTVTFKDAGVAMGTGPVNASGQATFTTRLLSVASHSITAEYGGDGNFNPSTSGTLTQIVNKADTTTAVAPVTAVPPANPSVFGQPVTFTATVTVNPPGSTAVTGPTGAVQFLIDGLLFGSPVLLSGGSATSDAISSLTVDSHTVTALYSGDGNFNATGATPGSTATPLSQVVEPAFTTTSLTSSSNPSVGPTVTLTATVAVVPPGAGTPGGSVRFLDGSTLVGSQVLSGGSESISPTASISPALAVGTHSITAVYGATTNFRMSTSAELSQRVDNLPPFFDPIPDESPTALPALSQTLTVDITGVTPGPANEIGQAVPLTARVTSSDPPGLVTILPDEATPLPGSPDSTRTLTYRIAPRTTGTATVEVHAMDDGGTPVSNTFSRTFTIDVRPPIVTGDITSFHTGSGPFVTVAVTITPPPGECVTILPPTSDNRFFNVLPTNAQQVLEGVPPSTNDWVTICTATTFNTVINLSQWIPNLNPNTAVEFFFVDGTRDLDPGGCPPTENCAKKKFTGRVSAGSLTVTPGNNVADKNVVTLQTVDLLGTDTTVKPLPGVEARVFDRNSRAFRGFAGSKNPPGSLYPSIFEAGSNAGQIASCTTSKNGVCLATEAQIGDYLVIIKFIDSVNQKLVYEGRPKGPPDFVDTNGDGIPDMATKFFTILKKVKIVNDQEVFQGYESGSKTNTIVIDCSVTPKPAGCP